MEDKIFKQALARYNKLMNNMCLEHLTIGTDLSENTDGWNVRDLVSECQYQLNTYYEFGHNNRELLYENKKAWKSETGKYKRFIKAYLPYIKGMKCHSRHCSKYDN